MIGFQMLRLTTFILLFILPVKVTLSAGLTFLPAQHKRPALSVSAALSGLAYEQASLMAGRSR
jgi:hypothetical protein